MRDKEVQSASDTLDGSGYGYDALDRLTTDQRTGGADSGTTSWGYDAAHDLTAITDTASGATSTLSYDKADELTGLVTSVGGATTANLTLGYDGDGNRTGQADSVSGSTAGYGWDQEDRLIAATVGAMHASYLYDGDGLRQQKTVNGTASTEVWDVSGHLPLLLQDGSTRYVTGPDGLPIEQVDGSGNVLYYYRDQLGATRGLLDGSGAVVATYSYDAYGKVTSHSGTAATPFEFAGQYTDAETGLVYLRVRYDDPATAQFLSRDPALALTRQPYEYVTNGTPALRA